MTKPIEQNKSSKMTLKTKNSLTGLAFVSIWIVGFLVFTVYPLIYTFYLSFQNVTVTASGIVTEFLGWDNYRMAIVLDTFVSNELTNYLAEMLVYIPVIMVVSLILALLLNAKFKGTGFFRTVFFLPLIITSGPVVKQLIENGVTEISSAASIADLESLYDILPQVLAESINFLFKNFIMIMWFCSVQILIYLAGLKKLDQSMFEAAKIDGAGKWETFWKLTLPAINPIIIVNVIYTVVTQSLFSLNPIIIKINAEMQNIETGYGYSSALAWVYTIVLILVLAVSVLLFYRREKKVKDKYSYSF